MRIKSLFYTNEEKRIRALWRLLIYVAVAAAIANPLVLALDTTDNRLLEGSLENLCVAVGFLAALWILCRFIDRRPVRDYGLYGLRSTPDVLIGFVIGGASMAVLVLAMWATGAVSFQATPSNQIPLYPFAVVFGGQLLRYIFGGLFEEVLSRGVMLRTFAESWSGRGRRKTTAIVTAWVVTSLAFGALHLGNPGATWIGAVNIALLGLALGTGMVITGNLAIPIGAHMGWNVVQNNFFGMPNGGKPAVVSMMVAEPAGPAILSGGDFGPEGSLLVPIAAVFMTMVTLGWLRFRQGRIGICVELAEPPRRSPLT